MPEEINPKLGYYQSKEYLDSIRLLRFTDKSKAAIKKANKRRKKPVRRSSPSADRARDLLHHKVRELMIKKSTYMDGVAAIPVFHRIAHEMDLTLTRLSLFVLMNHYRWITKADSEVWGYDREVFYQALREFRERGLVETFEEKGANKYVVSVKGHKLFATFQDKYHEGIKSFYVEYGKENPIRHYRARQYKKPKKDGTTKP